MTTAGWLFMSLSITAVLSLLVFCYRQVLRAPGADHEAPPAQATHPTEEEAQ